MDASELKDSTVAYVVGTAAGPAPAGRADASSDWDAKAQARASAFHKHLAASDEDTRRLISADPRVLHGAAVVAGTRISVYWIVSLIAQGYTVRRVLKLYPHLTEAQVRAALRFASIVLEARGERTE